MSWSCRRGNQQPGLCRAGSEHCDGHSYGRMGISGLLQADPTLTPTSSLGLCIPLVILPQTLDLVS